MLLKPLIDLHGAPKNWATSAPIYLQALADIPPDLLAKAVKFSLAASPYFPKPADLRAAIADELFDRRRSADEARRLSLPSPETIPPTPEDIAYVESVTALLPKHMRTRRKPEMDLRPEPIVPPAFPDADDPHVRKILAEMGEPI